MTPARLRVVARLQDGLVRPTVGVLGRTAALCQPALSATQAILFWPVIILPVESISRHWVSPPEQISKSSVRIPTARAGRHLLSAHQVEVVRTNNGSRSIISRGRGM